MRTNIMMASIARRVANSSLCGMSPNGQSSSSNSPLPYPTRMEKVKFGLPLEVVCGAHNDIPSPLLVMILKLHKEAPYKKDVFRAPGNQANMRKLIQFLQAGRLVNIENFSVHTIASVLKKFLRKLPSGVFGPQNERKLFDINCWTDTEAKCKEIQRILFSLPIVTQHLLVLLFGTFRSIVNSCSTGMTSESLSISVAPSFFHSCISDGNKFAKIEDVQRFKTASSIMKFMIDNFGIYNLFGKDNYEYYSRITRRVLNVEENWTFTFKYPPDDMIPSKTCLSVEKEWLNNECRKWNLPDLHLADKTKEANSNSVQECTSSATLCSNQKDDSRSRNIDVENQFTYPRLSMSLEENLVKNQQNSESPPSMVAIRHQTSSPDEQSYCDHPNPETLQLEDLKNVNHYAESTKSLSFLPMVHERQTQRMKTRSEWFLKTKENNCGNQLLSNSNRSQAINAAKVLIKKSSSKEKRAVRRSSSKKDKSSASGNNNSEQSSHGKNESKSANVANNSYSLPTSFKKMTESDCTECNVRQMNIKYTYKSKF